MKREISEQLFWKNNKVPMSPETKMYQNTIPGHYIAQQCHNSKRVIFQADFKGFEVLKSSECNDDTNALQRRILQTAL